MRGKNVLIVKNATRFFPMLTKHTRHTSGPGLGLLQTTLCMSASTRTTRAANGQSRLFVFETARCCGNARYHTDLKRRASGLSLNSPERPVSVFLTTILFADSHLNGLVLDPDGLRTNVEHATFQVCHPRNGYLPRPLMNDASLRSCKQTLSRTPAQRVSRPYMDRGTDMC